MSDDRFIGIKVTVLPDTSQEAATVIERLSHVLTGLALEGIAGQIKVTPYELEDDDTDAEESRD